MAQPTDPRPALCPSCRRRLKLVLRVPDMDDEWLKLAGHTREDIGKIDEARDVYGSIDMGAALLWVSKAGGGYEEIMRDSAGAGAGPDGAAHGDVECLECGPFDVDDLCAAFERRASNAIDASDLAGRSRVTADGTEY